VTSDAAWATLAVLGVYHGINPAMGWLFAVSRGMQERSRRAVLRSLLPIAIGHEASIALVALLVIGLSTTTDPKALRIGAAAALIAFGIFRFVKPRAHFRWTSMRVSDRELSPPSGSPCTCWRWSSSWAPSRSSSTNASACRSCAARG
jgi:hypothetical protein